MKLEFEPIGSVDDAEEVAAIVQLRTLFTGATFVNDLDWDEDQLLQSYLDTVDDAEVRRDLAAEPAAGIDEARNRLLSEVRLILTARCDLLGMNCPFERGDGGDLLLTSRTADQFTPAAWGYLWLVLFWLIQSDRHYLALAEAERKAFAAAFAKAFEQICCLVLVGRRPTAVWYLGSSRSVHDLLARLRSLTRSLGTGQVKAFEHLEENQTSTNDAGVDLVAVEHDVEGNIRRDALAYLVSATLQKANRRGKILSIPEVNRFTDFFRVRPTLTYKGVLAIPFDRSTIEELNCRDQDCVYLPKDEILTYLGRFPERPRRARHAAAILSRASKELALSLVLADNDDGLKLPMGACAPPHAA